MTNNIKPNIYIEELKKLKYFSDLPKTIQMALVEEVETIQSDDLFRDYPVKIEPKENGWSIFSVRLRGLEITGEATEFAVENM